MIYKITSITNEDLNLIVKDENGVVNTVPLKNGESTFSSVLTTSMRIFHKRQMVELFEVEKVLTGTNIGGGNFTNSTMTEANPNDDEVLDHMHGTQEETVLPNTSKMTATPGVPGFVEGGYEQLIINSDNIDEQVEKAKQLAAELDNKLGSDKALEKAAKETEAYVEVSVKQINGEGEKVGVWTEEEEKYIKRYYPTKGGKFVSEKLNRSYKSVQKKVARLGLKKKKKKSSK